MYWLVLESRLRIIPTQQPCFFSFLFPFLSFFLFASWLFVELSIHDYARLSDEFTIVPPTCLFDAASTRSVRSEPDKLLSQQLDPGYPYLKDVCPSPPIRA